MITARSRGGRPAAAIYFLLLTAWALLLTGCGGVSDSGPQLTSLSIGPPDAVLAKGTTTQLVATGIYSDGTRRELASRVSWSSANPSVASVSGASASTALLTAVGVGATTITATLGNISGTTGLTVTAATLVSLQLTPGSVNGPAGSSVQLTVTGTYTDESTQNLTAAAAWTTSSPLVATVGSGATAGLLTLRAVGAVAVTATLNGVSATSSAVVTPATLSSIDVTPTAPHVAAGLTQPFVATGVYSDGSTHDLTASVTWSSSAPACASISNATGSTGLASTASAGSSTIMASYEGRSGSTSLSVTAATLVSIGVTPPPNTPAGLTFQFTATGVFTDQSTHDVTAMAVWSSSTPAVATVSNATGFNGRSTAVTPGSTTITATVGAISGTAPLTVTAATVVSLAITPAAISIPNGSTERFAAMGTYTDGTVQPLTTAVTWSSASPNVATQSNAAGSNGVATSVGQGSTTITAALGSLSASATLTVSAAALASIGVTPIGASIARGTAQQFTATGIYTDNSLQDLTTSVSWNSSVGAVAAISNAAGSNGLATATTSGTTTIAASFGGISGSTGFTVKATSLVAIAVTPAGPSIGLGTTQPLSATGTFSDQSTQDLTSEVTWAAVDSTVAVVRNEPGFNGLTLAEGVGSTNISATLDGTSGYTSLTVTPAALTSITATPANSNLPTGTQQQFAATGHYSDGTTQDLTASVTWTSQDSTITSISNAAGSVGLATGLNPGSTTISATLGGIADTTGLTVVDVTLVAIAVTPLESTTPQGFSQRFVATGTYSDGSNRDLSSAVTWLSNTPAVASISNAAGSNGLATTSAVGSTGISATLGTIGSLAVPLTVIGAQEYAYVANNGYGTVSQYRIAAGGVLMPLNPATVPAGTYPASIGLDPAYRYAYVANNDGTVSQYAIGTDGSLVPMTTASVPAGSFPQALVVDPTGRFVYVVNNGDGTLSQFAIGAGGSLTPLNPATVAVGGFPEALAVDPSGRYLYVANGDGTVAELTIGSDGTLTAMSPASVMAGDQPQAVAVDPSGRFVYVANGGDNTVSQFSLRQGGLLSALNPAVVVTGNDPTSVAVDPSGRSVYVAASSDGTLWQYGIGPDGSLGVINAGIAQAGGTAQFVSVDLRGLYIYAADDNDVIGQFVLGAGGTLPTGSPSTTPTGGPVAIVTGY